MDIILQELESFNWTTIIATCLRILLVLVLAWAAMLALRKLLERLEKHLLRQDETVDGPPSEAKKRVETIIRLVRQAALIVLWVTITLVILKEIGVDVAPIVASAGIVGLAVGFGAQNLVRDFIAGFFFILENQVRVGDVAVVNGTGGLVEKLNFRTIVLRDLGGVVHTFPNGTVTTLSNMTHDWSAYLFDMGVAYKEDTDKVTEIIKKVCADLRKDPEFKPFILEDVEIFGVDKFADSAVIIKGRIKTKPISQWRVGREFNRRIKYAFDEADIEIPFPHRTMYFGDVSKPVELKIMEKHGDLSAVAD